jgi:hypothetical protein
VQKPLASEIALRADEFKTLYLAQQLSLITLLHPELSVLRHLQSITGGGDDLPLVLKDGPEEEVLVFSTREILRSASQLRGDVIRDMIFTGGHFRAEVPLLQFARHFRNACAHGDRWHFHGDEPKRPAVCRHLTLTPDLHGQRATWTKVTPRLFVGYLDDIATYFTSDSPAPANAG